MCQKYSIYTYIYYLFGCMCLFLMRKESYLSLIYICKFATFLELVYTLVYTVFIYTMFILLVYICSLVFLVWVLRHGLDDPTCVRSLGVAILPYLHHYQHCTDEAQKAETVLSAVSYIYIYIYIYILSHLSTWCRYEMAQVRPFYIIS